QMGPRQIVAALSAEFEDHLDTTQIENCINRIETAIKAAHPAVTGLFIKPQTQAMWNARIAGLADEATPGP
ncbi:MAG: cation transporter, partial [Pseudoxanthomonas sp.]